MTSEHATTDKTRPEFGLTQPLSRKTFDLADADATAMRYDVAADRRSSMPIWRIREVESGSQLMQAYFTQDSAQVRAAPLSQSGPARRGRRDSVSLDQSARTRTSKEYVS